MTRWQRLRQEMKEKNLNEWGIWQTQREWEDAQWFATAKASQAKLDELLATKRVSRSKAQVIQSLTYCAVGCLQYTDDPPNFGTM